MAEKVARSHAFRRDGVEQRELREEAANRRVPVELSVIHRNPDRRRGEGFGARPDGEHGVCRCGEPVGSAAQAVAFASMTSPSLTTATAAPGTFHASSISRAKSPNPSSPKAACFLLIRPPGSPVDAADDSTTQAEP